MQRVAPQCQPDGFQKDNAASRYFHYGVREHAMAAISNGLFAHGGVRPFCATFLNFIGYALGAVRVSALSNMGILYIMTHDSIGLGKPRNVFLSLICTFCGSRLF